MMIRRSELFAATLFIACTASAQPSCDLSTLDRASSAYSTGWFGETLDLLAPCVPAGFEMKRERVSAYRLLALSHIATDSLEQARMWVKHLVEVDSRYRPDPREDPPLFVGYVNELRPSWYSWLWRGGAWYKWAGRGALLAGAVALPIVLKGSPEPNLPIPPAFPPR